MLTAAGVKFGMDYAEMLPRPCCWPAGTEAAIEQAGLRRGASCAPTTSRPTRWRRSSSGRRRSL